jgi:hypothetical protein
MRTFLKILVSAAVIGILFAGSAKASEPGDLGVRLSTGIEYSSGTYGGEEDIEELYVPVTMRLDQGRWALRLTVPYVRVSETASMPTESGLGDVIAGVTMYDVYVNKHSDFFVDLTGRVKFGTADEEKGLGTGENDYTIQASAYKYLSYVTLQGMAGYRFRGEPEGYSLNDVVLASFGGVFGPAPATSLGLFYDFRESALANADDIHEVSGFVSRRFNDSWRMEFYVFTGFGDSSADWGGGLLVTTDLRELRISDRD